MKVLTIIVFLGMVQLAQLALAETYNCPAGQSNALEPGQTIQTSGQPRCDKAMDRSLRSDVCNSYFCSELQVYMTGGDAVTPTMIIAGVGDQMRTSPILMP